MASDNPAKYMWEENYLDRYGPGKGRDVVDDMWGIYEQQGAANKPLTTALNQARDYANRIGGLARAGEGYIQAGQSAGIPGMERIANAGAPQINMRGLPTVGGGPDVRARMAQGEDAKFNMGLVNRITRNAPVEAALAAANRDMYRQLGENTLTNIGMNAAQGGNAGATRRGAAEAIAGRAALDRGYDVAGQMTSDAYRMGTDIASRYGLQNAQLGTQANLANQDAALRAALANQATRPAGSTANAGNWLQGQGLNLNAKGQQNALAGNMWQNMANMGLQAMPTTQNMMTGAANLGMQAGQGFQQMPWYGVQQFANTALPFMIPGAAGMPQQGGGWMGQLGGLAGGIGGLLQGFGALSDRRLKENIRTIGRYGPLRIVRWDWNAFAKDIGADKNPGEGFIAQEVLEHYPERVLMRQGYLAIDYPGLYAQLKRDGHAAELDRESEAA